MREVDSFRSPDILTDSFEKEDLVQDALTRARSIHQFKKKKEREEEQKPVTSGVDKDDQVEKDQNRWKKYQPIEPKFTFDLLVLPEKVKKIVMRAADSLLIENGVFDDWGFREIANPRSAINFYGMPGTGKTMTAHALAYYLERDILVASYAEIGSMYHGEGPKNVKAVFEAAEKRNAILLIDEADSLLSKRLTRVTQGSDQAINSMRSQLLMSLENFEGIVIFCTNLLENYDKAFESRMLSVEIPMPDEECRKVIWDNLIVKKCPRSDDVDVAELAKKYDDVCGREIKNCILTAATDARLVGAEELSMEHLTEAMDEIIESRFDENGGSQELSKEAKEDIGKKIRKKLSRKKLSRRNRNDYRY